MKTPVSFMSANFVARQLDYNMTEGWMQGDEATQAWFRPLDTYRERFDTMLREVVAMGFTAIDIWGAHLHWSWATDEHVAAAKELLATHGLRPMTYAGSPGHTLDDTRRAAEICGALGIKGFAGGSPLLKEDRAALVALLDEYDLVLGIENHPEKNPGEVLERMGRPETPRIRAAIDTGWFGTQGYDAAKAIRELKDVLWAVHLKDVKAAGAHETCRFGEGVVDIEACVVALKEIGFDGPLCVEHEPEHHDPTADCIACRTMLASWLGA